MPAVKGQKKELKIRLAKNTCLYEVYYDEGGERPKDLSGLYTCEKAAQLAIDKYTGTKGK